MTATDPYTALRPDLTGQPPLTEPVFPPGHPDGPPNLAPAPPGMVWTMLADGTRQLAYLPPGYEKSPAPGTPTPAAPAERDKWPLRLVTGGGATAAVLGVIGHYGPGINQAGHGAEMAGIAVAATAAGVGILVSVVKASFGGTKQPINLSVNVTNTNTSRSTSSSRSKHRNR